MTEPSPDELLLRRFLDRRDERAFDALYHRHTPRMYGLALRLTAGDEAEAIEVVQEGWVRAVSALAGFGGRARLSTWLCGICVNVWRERLRRARPLVSLGEADPGVDPPDTLRGIDLGRALDRLPPGYRAVLVLHGMYGYPHAEVARMLGVAEGTSKSQYLRGRRALREALMHTDEEMDP